MDCVHLQPLLPVLELGTPGSVVQISILNARLTTNTKTVTDSVTESRTETSFCMQFHRNVKTRNRNMVIGQTIWGDGISLMMEHLDKEI